MGKVLFVFSLVVITKEMIATQILMHFGLCTWQQKQKPHKNF